MLHLKNESLALRLGRAGRKCALSFSFTLLAIEFLDEFVFGVREVSWPLVRNDLQLSYTEIGLLMSVPSIFGCVVEPVLGILGDVWKRRAIILGGGIFFTLAFLLIAVSNGFTLLLLAFMLFSPASGAFVNLSQAALMDAAPARREQNMARWELAGSLGNVVGPLALGLALMVGAGWRGVHVILFALSLMLVAAAWRFPFVTPSADMEQHARIGLWKGVRQALRALKRREVLRWLILLELADLVMDGLHGYLALYFVDVVGLSEAQAGLSLIVWTCAGLPGDILLLPLLERVRGLSYLRLSALVILLLFPAFLLVPGVTLKLVVLGLIGFSNAGWYSILKAQLYAAMPGQSGAVMALGNLSGLFTSLVPLGLGLFAERFGLGAAMWLLLLGPIALLFGVPRESK
ncbi:MAG: MFS transporter [Pyrinomonadaceae bacterium]|nr:MFS transporter [Pyrinomonadaceae bacterium]